MAWQRVVLCVMLISVVAVSSSAKRNRRSSQPVTSQENFQQCLVGCFDNNVIGGCLPAYRRQKAFELFVNQLVAEVSNVLGDVGRMKSIAVHWVRWNVDLNCQRFTYRLLEEKTSNCFERCHGRHYASPFNVDHSWATLCEEAGREGVLCSRFRLDSVTAGGEFVNKGCARREHDYSWSWTTYKKWDFCCESPCVRGQCTVGVGRTAYCGSPGYVTVNGRPCSSDFPCGLHNETYYWCYTDRETKAWDYCCWHKTERCSNSRQPDGVSKCDVHRPGEKLMKACGGETSMTINGEQCRSDFPCSTHETTHHKDYYWCTKPGGVQDYCCNPDHPCDYYGYEYSWCYTSATGNSTWKRCHSTPTASGIRDRLIN